MSAPKTLFAKIWDAHVTTTTAAGADLVAIDRVFLHERTGASALKSMATSARPVKDPKRVFAVMDHIVDTRPGRNERSGGDQTLMEGGQSFITETRAAALAAGITLFDVTDPDQGITHVISPELGIVARLHLGGARQPYLHARRIGRAGLGHWLVGGRTCDGHGRVALGAAQDDAGAL
jgi:3-isopropylmalate/(R)-2-methylmalate dehydratase large subunit